jgi:hypothetical protein
MLGGVLLFAGCDRGGSPAAAPSASAAAAAPAGDQSPADAYDRYRKTLTPLSEELTRMRLLLDRPAEVDRAEFVRQHREVVLRHGQVEQALAAEDRARASWARVGKVMAWLQKARDGLDREHALALEADRLADERRTSPAAGPPAPGSSGFQDWLAAAKGRDERVRGLTKATALLGAELPKTLATAAGEILLFESDLREGR